MAYSPRLSLESSRTLRRIAWALGKPMTKTSEDIIAYLVNSLNEDAICQTCRDKTKCGTCHFKLGNQNNKIHIKSLMKS
ncbi:hypothetical protein EHQ81_19380 [Leptospira selangorensis]|uniref:Uncharacterized protein n=1 Tax=Leptospira selangorensis TaxID=2484982 RepID=A0A5F2C9L4_9LEPT|nr:hypothetical protein EHQ81_19380 [Leptospira selangorensis]TGM27932.1 hypothetical protein EHQ82_01555 [Leptospira selangorensis]